MKYFQSGILKILIQHKSTLYIVYDMVLYINKFLFKCFYEG